MAIMAALAYGLFYSFQAVAAFFEGLGKESGTLVVIGVTTTLVCTFIITASTGGSRRQGGETALQLEKIRLYRGLVQLWGNMLIEPKVALTDTERTNRYELESRLSLIVGGAVLKLYTSLRAMGRDRSVERKEVAGQFGRVVREMRKDIGQIDNSIRESDLLTSLFGPP